MAEYLVPAAGAVMLAALILAMIRFLAGPDTMSRVVALDVMTVIATPMIALFALVAGRGIYLDVALVYAILAFLGVIVVGRYFEGGV